MNARHIDREKLKNDRVSKLRSVMKKNSLDFFIGTTFDTVRYVTDCRYVPIIDYFIDIYAVVLPADGLPTLFAPWVEGAPMGYAEVSPPSYLASPLAADKWASLFADAVKKQGQSAARIGFDYFSYAVYQAVREKLPQSTLVPAMYDLLKARAVKTAEEVALLKRTASILDKGMTAGLKSGRAGISEFHVMAKIESAMMEAGAESLPWLNFRSGTRTLTSIFSNGRKLKRGDVYVFDIGVMSDGYYGDAARTGVVGVPNKKVRDVYDALYDCYMEGVAKIRPGIKGSEIDDVIRRGLRERGYPDYSTSSGHGIGMRVTEFPWITRKEEAGDFDMEFQAGMVVCVEPRTYLDKVTAVGIEDMILVTESGHEMLTHASRKIS